MKVSQGLPVKPKHECAVLIVIVESRPQITTIGNLHRISGQDSLKNF